jgi:hypothetical protein
MTARAALARSACAVAVLAVIAGLALWLPGAIQARTRLKGRWKATHDGLEYKVHFFQGQDAGDGVLKGYFSERISNGYRGSGQYELRMQTDRGGTITLHDHSLGTIVGSVQLGSRRLELGNIVYYRQ